MVSTKSYPYTTQEIKNKINRKKKELTPSTQGKWRDEGSQKKKEGKMHSRPNHWQRHSKLNSTLNTTLSPKKNFIIWNLKNYYQHLMELKKMHLP